MRQPLVSTGISVGVISGRVWQSWTPSLLASKQLYRVGRCLNEGLFLQREESDNEEVRAEQGKGPGVGMKRKASKRSETRSEALGEAIEMMQKPSVTRRNVNWQRR